MLRATLMSLLMKVKINKNYNNNNNGKYLKKRTKEVDKRDDVHPDSRQLFK